jgi:hypothetical protein
MAEPNDLATSAATKERRLESWGEIAAYLRREIRRRAAAKVRRMLNKSRAARFLSLDI